MTLQPIVCGPEDKMLRLSVCVLVACMLLGQASGHTYFSPLDFLRHDSASTKWGERKPGAGQIGGGGACKTTSLYSYIQG